MRDETPPERRIRSSGLAARGMESRTLDDVRSVAQSRLEVLERVGAEEPRHDHPPLRVPRVHALQHGHLVRKRFTVPCAPPQSDWSHSRLGPDPIRPIPAYSYSRLRRLLLGVVASRVASLSRGRPTPQHTAARQQIGGRVATIHAIPR